MRNLRPIYLLIAVLFIWNLTISVILNEKNTAVQDEIIVENNVNGISTDLTKTVDKIKSSCVTIETPAAVSSGFIYQTDENGAYVVTAYHSVADASLINVTLDNGITVEASIFGEDIFGDIAVLYIETDFKLSPVTLGDSFLLKDGEFLISIGCSGNKEYSNSTALSIVSSASRFIGDSISYDDISYEYYLETIQYASTMVKGYSGAALFNMNGETVGVNILSDGNNCFGLTSNELKMIVDNIIGNKNLTKLFLDIRGTYISKMENYTKSNLGISIEEVNGFYVSFVRFNSLGFELGLKNGDIIKTINGIEIKTSRDYYNAIYTSLNEISIEVIRNGESLILIGTVND
ncbi:MAG: S1C family serine protease [Erysipelotrichaceae bacterium]